MSKVIGLGISVILVFLLLFGCTQPNKNQFDFNDQNLGFNIQNGFNNNTNNNNNGGINVETPEFERGDISYTIKESFYGIDGNKNLTKFITKDKGRMDIDVPEGLGKLFILPSGMFQCGIQEGAWICMTLLDPLESSDYDSSKHVLDLEERNGSVDELQIAPRVIAGENTNCFKGTVDGDEVEWCLNKRGIVFYSEGSYQGEKGTMIVTEYTEGPISPDIFTLPGKVITIYDLIGSSS